MSPIDETLVRFASDLVRIPTVLGGERRAAERVAAEMEHLGYGRVAIDRFGNVSGEILGQSSGPTVVLDGHLDTVDVDPRDAWSRDPWSGEVSGDRLHGRGASDMKGAVAAMVTGAAEVDRSALSGRIVVVGSVGEEQIEGAALREVMRLESPDFVIIGEASGLDVVRAGRGRAEMVVTTHGVPAHASTPEQGTNAVHLMARVSAELRRLPMPEHSFVGPGAMCLTDIVSVPYPAHSVVPSGCRATWERRLVPGEAEEGLLAEMELAFVDAGAPETTVEIAETDYVTDSGVEWRQPKWFPPWELAEDHFLIERARSGLRGIGQQPELASYRFCTNAAYSAGIAGVPTIGYGPSHERLVHVVDEYLELEQLQAAAEGYCAVLEAVLAN